MSGPVRSLRSCAGRLLKDAPRARAACAEARATGESSTTRPAYRECLRILTADCRSVLDVGTGVMRSLAGMKCAVRVGLDAHRPYLEHREVADAVPVNASALDLERLFVPGAVELVTAIDVLEHLPPDDAREMLRQATGVAAKRVVLFTPRGEFPQDDHDAFGLGGEELQRHRSAWEPEDLRALGFSVIVFEGYHDHTNASFVEAFGADHPPVDALLAFRDAG